MTEPASEIKKFTSVTERIAELNSEAEKRQVWNSIDRPIRPLVYELNRLGIRTLFSCCGFSYKEEEEPKSHARNAYVFVRGPEEGTHEDMKAFFRVIHLAKTKGWNVGIAHPAPNSEWEIVYYTNVTTWGKFDGLNEAIHDYETKLTAIANLTRALKVLPTRAPNEMIIVDGNHTRSGNSEWIIKPKQSSKFVLSGKVVGEAQQ